MKKFITICFLVCFTSLSFAQGTVDTDPSEKKGLDVTSILIGAAVGIVVGYLIKANMDKK